MDLAHKSFSDRSIERKFNFTSHSLGNEDKDIQRQKPFGKIVCKIYIRVLDLVEKDKNEIFAHHRLSNFYLLRDKKHLRDACL